MFLNTNFVMSSVQWKFETYKSANPSNGLSFSLSCWFFYDFLHFLLALDMTLPLPLFNLLVHLTYLTSTSPQIHKIMTMDSGLERLVQILHEFCICPAPPENPAILLQFIMGFSTSGSFGQWSNEYVLFFKFSWFYFTFLNRMILWIILLLMVQHHTFYSFPTL